MITEEGPDQSRWPVAAAWVVSPWARAEFLYWRIDETGGLPANLRFLGIHERLIRQLNKEGKQELLQALTSRGAGLFTYAYYSVRELLAEPRFIEGAYAGYWPDILEEIETYRFLEKY